MSVRWVSYEIADLSQNESLTLPIAPETSDRILLHVSSTPSEHYTIYKVSDACLQCHERCLAGWFRGRNRQRTRRRVAAWASAQQIQCRASRSAHRPPSPSRRILFDDLRPDENSSATKTADSKVKRINVDKSQIPKPETKHLAVAVPIYLRATRHVG